jgi:hypothetical protein
MIAHEYRFLPDLMSGLRSPHLRVTMNAAVPKKGFFVQRIND